jgi:hypothetical protein
VLLAAAKRAVQSSGGLPLFGIFLNTGYASSALSWARFVSASFTQAKTMILPFAGYLGRRQGDLRDGSHGNATALCGQCAEPSVTFRAYRWAARIAAIARYLKERYRYNA